MPNQEKTKYKEFTQGDTVFFIYDKYLPCVEGVLKEIINRESNPEYFSPSTNGNIAFRIHWIEGGWLGWTSTISCEHTFLNQFACKEYFKNGFYKYVTERK